MTGGDSAQGFALRFDGLDALIERVRF